MKSYLEPSTSESTFIAKGFFTNALTLVLHFLQAPTLQERKYNQHIGIITNFVIPHWCSLQMSMVLENYISRLQTLLLLVYTWHN